MRIFLLPAALLLLAGCAPLPRPGQSAPETLPVAAAPVPLDPADPSRERLGALVWRGGLVLTSSDRRLGGLSSLRWDEGELLAASDEGDFFALTPREAGGRLIGIARARIRRLAGRDGRPLPRIKAQSDFESLELRHGAAIVSLETDSTIWRYALRDHLPVGAPVELRQAAAWRGAQSRTNGGIEAHAIGGGLRLMLSEELREPDGGVSAMLIDGAREQRLGIPFSGVFVPTDAILLDARTHSFLILQRSYSKATGMWMRLARLSLRRDTAGSWRASAPETLATLGPPLTSDNMEGLAIRREGGRTMLYMVSDDNFSKNQRTLLMKWELVG